MDDIVPIVILVVVALVLLFLIYSTVNIVRQYERLVVFTLVEISIIKQLGFGLATAIFVDATLIRMVLVPAFMKIGGKWNWYPGERKGRADGI